MKNEDLSRRTKENLAAALKNAMEKKPLSKISVSELCNACDLNRKTFYYHFEDIYALLRWMLEEEAIEVVRNFDLLVNLEETIRFIMDYVENNKHIIICAYDSMGHEEIKRFFYNDFIGIISNAINMDEKQLGLHVEPQVKEFLSVFYTEASAGMLMDWIRNRHRKDREITIQNLLIVYRVTIPAALKAKKLSESGAHFPSVPSQEG